MLLLGMNACFCGRGTHSVYGVLNPFQLSVFHIESSRIICSANQMASFYMKYKIGRK